MDCLDVLFPLYLFDYLLHKAPFRQAGNKCFLMQLRGLGLWRLDKRPEPEPLTGTERLRAVGTHLQPDGSGVTGPKLSGGADRYDTASTFTATAHPS